ncbi:hypothetical protein RP20_CCG015798 [Aedes albopictus]|nr:hypothetical protein RP20_CCG015798 [Aedes albopictus]
MGSFVSRTPPANMSGPVADFVKSAIVKDKPFKKLNQPFTCYELDQRNDGDEIQSVLGSITGAKTVPRVFINGNFVGGGTDIKKMYSDGRLEKLLA